MALWPLWPHEYRFESCVLLCCWRALWVGWSGTWQSPVGGVERQAQVLAASRTWVAQLESSWIMNTVQKHRARSTIDPRTAVTIQHGHLQSFHKKKPTKWKTLNMYFIWSVHSEVVQIKSSSCSSSTLTLISSPQKHDKMLHTTQQENSPHTNQWIPNRMGFSKQEVTLNDTKTLIS